MNNPKRRYADNICVDSHIRRLYASIWDRLTYYYNTEGYKFIDSWLMLKLGIKFNRELIEINKELGYSNDTSAYVATVLLRQGFELNKSKSDKPNEY